MKKVAFLSYFFPPSGGAGVQRSVKFTKYLPSFGYQPVVVTVGSEYSGQARDESMLDEVKNIRRYEISPSGLERAVSRVSGSKLFRHFTSDKLRGYGRALLRKGLQAIEVERCDIIFATASPFMMAQVGASCAGKSGLPFVLDLRDPWALDPFTYYSSRFNWLGEIVKMRRACERADAVIMNTPRSLEAVRKSFPHLDSEKFYCVTNGWDREDFASTGEGQPDRGSLRIVHTGHFHTRLAIDVDPLSRSELGFGRGGVIKRIKYCPGGSNLLARTPYYLFKAVRRLLDEHKISRDDVRMVFAGSVSVQDKKLAERFGVEDMVEYCGYLDHTRSVEILKGADVLFLPLHKPAGGGYPLIVPGKTYEYMASGRAILGALPKGDAADFVKKSGLGVLCDPCDVDGMADKILGFVQKKKREGRIRHKIDEDFVGRFERRRLTCELAKIFDSMG
jgi:glycosyltransferase involved in cell wall biosynthesis